MVIVPKSTMGNWLKEFARWCPCIKAVKFHGNREERVRACIGGRCVCWNEVRWRRDSAILPLSWAGRCRCVPPQRPLPTTTAAAVPLARLPAAGGAKGGELPAGQV